MPDLSFVAALLGGVLAILSPCSALLLPAFFAVACTSRARLVTQAAAFYLGLATLFVPLGLGVSLIASLFVDQRELVIAVAGAALVGFGLYTLAGGGFELAPGVASRLHRVEGRYTAYATGLAYGVAGFCTGPILGAVLAIAAASGQAAVGAALLATYALGMTVPVFALALVWDRWKIGERTWLRGATVDLLGSTLPVSRLVAGLLFILMGVIFVLFRGSSALGALYESFGLTDLAQAIQVRLEGIDLDRWIAAAAVIGVSAWLARRRLRSRAAPLVRGTTPLAERMR